MLGELCLEGCCGGRCQELILVMVYNSNCEIDDTLAISINETDLGSIDNGADACTGRIFYCLLDVPDLIGPAPNRNNVTGIACMCPGDDFGATETFDKEVFIDGYNFITVESEDNNDNGNYGIITIGCYKWNAETEMYESEATILADSYSHNSGAGHSSIKPFVYPPTLPPLP